MPVQVYNEWDPLEEVIVGTAKFAQVPYFDFGMNSIEPQTRNMFPSPTERRYPRWVIEETEEDIEVFIETVQKLGIVVRRPEPIDFQGLFRTPFWESEYYFQYCPRDILLAIGDTIIETPNPFRSRYFETLAYRNILVDYLRQGARWISAPKPSLKENLYDPERTSQSALLEIEPAFDAANILRAGHDILYLVSDSGNELGCRWLQSTLGPEYRVHPCRNLYSGTHIDSTLTLVRPGLAIINPERVNQENVPEPLKRWDLVPAPPMTVPAYSDLPPISSEWLGLNLLMINPNLAIVDSHQTQLIRLLESLKVDVIPLRLRHGRPLAGGFHCITLDVRRKGKLEQY